MRHRSGKSGIFREFTFMQENVENSGDKQQQKKPFGFSEKFGEFVVFQKLHDRLLILKYLFRGPHCFNPDLVIKCKNSRLFFNNNIIKYALYGSPGLKRENISLL